jgi:hypothetical protein
LVGGGFGAPFLSADVVCDVCGVWVEQATEEGLFDYLADLYLGNLENEKQLCI